MGHALQALLFLQTRALERLPAAAHRVELPQSIVLVPWTDELFDRLVMERGAAGDEGGVFQLFHPAMLELGREASGGHPFAYIETEYFGGQGAQAAAAWHGATCMVPPRSAAIGPINEALRALRVVANRGSDEFDTIGLSRHRHTEDWLPAPR
jgi:hypothetical protein